MSRCQPQEMAEDVTPARSRHGIDRRTGQYMLHGEEGIKFARAVVRLPEANKFDKVELSKVASTPWDLHRPRETEVIFKDKEGGAGGSHERGQDCFVTSRVHQAR